MNFKHLHAVVLCVGIFIFWAFLLGYKYFHFGFYDWDLAFFTQACWQLIHGQQFVSVAGINYFGDHSYFFTLVFLPFFALFPHALTLLILKAISFAVGSYLFYCLIKEKMGEKTALVWLFLYVIFPANIFSMLYDFNPENFAMPLLFWMFLALQRQRWWQLAFAAVLLMSLKENMGLLVFMFGFVGAFKGKEARWPCIILAWVGLLVFYTLAFHVIPHFRAEQSHGFVVRYNYLGNSLGEIIRNCFFKPDQVLHQICSATNQKFISDLFGPFALVALLGWRPLLVLLPLLLQHLLSKHPPEHSIYFHYGMTMAVFIFLGYVDAFVLMFKHTRFKKTIMAIVVAISLFHSVNLIKKNFPVRWDHSKGVALDCRWKLVRSIPPDEAVISTFDYLAPLALRKELYSFQKVYDNTYQSPLHMAKSELHLREPFKLPGHVRYALIDYRDMWLMRNQSRKTNVVNGRINDFLKSGGWKKTGRCGSLFLFTRGINSSK